MKPETVSQAMPQASRCEADVAPGLRRPYQAPALRPLGTFRARTLSGGSHAPDSNQSHLATG